MMHDVSSVRLPFQHVTDDHEMSPPGTSGDSSLSTEGRVSDSEGGNGSEDAWPEDGPLLAEDAARK